MCAAASFMSSFGDDGGSDEEYAGTSKRRAGGAGKNAGSDDDLWSDLAPKAASTRSAGGSKDRAYNPFMIASSVCVAAVLFGACSCADAVLLWQTTPKSGAATADADIPIDNLPSVDASIFKDFGADPKKKKGKGEAAGAAHWME